MAPKRASGSSRKAAAGSRASAARAPEPGTAAALQAEFDGAGESQQKRRRQLGRRASDEQVERCVQAHFGDLPKSVVETCVVNGQSLRSRIRHDLKNLKDEVGRQKRLGVTYWRTLRLEYAGGADGVSTLKVQNSSQPVRDELIQAIEAAVRTNPASRTVEPLVVLLQHTGVLNQKELVGLIKALFANTNIGRQNMDTVHVELMKYFVRHNQTEVRKVELRCLLPSFDAALARQFTRLKRAGVTPTTWLRSHVELASVLLDRSDMDAVLAAGSWKEVSPQVARLTTSCQLGAALFQFAGVMANSATFADEVKSELTRLFQGGATELKLGAFKSACEEKARHYCSSGLLVAKRKVTVDFIGVGLPILVQGASAEWELRLWSEVKSRCIGTRGGVRAMEYEEWLFPGREAQQCTAPDFLFDSMKAARVCAEEIIQSVNPGCFDEMRRALISNASTLCSLDRSFRLELEFLENSAVPLLEQAVETRILERLPTPAATTTVNQTASALAELRSSRFGSMVSHTGQAKIDAVHELVANMSRGICPATAIGQQEGFYASVLSKLAFFMTFEIPGQTGDTPTEPSVVAGQPAVAAAFAAMKLRMAGENTQVKLVDFEPLQTFKWLLSADECTLLGNWVTTTLQNMAASSSQAPQRIGHSSSAAPANKKAKKASEPKSSEVMAFFG